MAIHIVVYGSWNNIKIPYDKTLLFINKFVSFLLKIKN